MMVQYKLVLSAVVVFYGFCITGEIYDKLKMYTETDALYNVQDNSR